MNTSANFARASRPRQFTETGNIISSIKNSTLKPKQAIDGFVKAPLNSTAEQPTRIPSSQFHKRAEKAHTLMRSGLKKPAKQFQTGLRRFKPGSNPEREQRAKFIPRHSHVDRFGVPAARSKADSKTTGPAVSGELVSAGSMAGAKTAGAVVAPLPSMITSVSHQKLERLLDEALTRADSHKQALRYQASRHFWHRRWFTGPRRWLTIAGICVCIGVFSILAWQKIPQLSVRLAGMRAHLSAAVPGYQPEGYKMAGPAKAASGAVSIQYKLAADANQSYEIDQAQSSLTSTMVAQNVVPKGSTVQTSQVQGNTVYIYGPDNDAAWVNNGVLYTVKDRANLSSDELIKIVHGIDQ